MRISQCMIVKNEEANIERALSWGKEFVWEQIVVDTGSTDRTVELAESMGAQVYHYNWIDDFSAAKNFAVSKASGDWIAFLDADEYFDENGVKELADLLEKLQSTEADAVTTALVNLKSDGTVGTIGSQVRVFRNKPELRYKRCIHEQLVADGGRKLLRFIDATENLSVFHTGYCQEVYEEKKSSGRNLRLLQKELKEHPGDHEILGYLGDEYRDMGYPEEAGRYYRQAIENMPLILDELDARSAATFSSLLQIMIGKKAPDEEIERIYQKGTALLPREGDFDYLVGRYFASEGKYLKGIQYLEKALEKLENFGTNNHSMQLQSHLQDAYEVMAVSCFQEGDLRKAINHSVAVLKYNPYSMLSLVTLLKIFKGEDETPMTPAEQVAGFLKKLYNIQSSEDRQILLTATRELQWPDLEDALNRLFKAVGPTVLPG